MYQSQNHQRDIFSMSRRMPLLGFFGSNASDDDFADRLNYKYTVAILIIFAFVVTNKHFGHNQINCWVPALFSKNFEEYTNLVCWITNTYYIPFDKHLPNTEQERRPTELRYYQWVAYILLFLSLLFYLPRIIWRTLSLRSGVDIKDIIEASHDFKSVSKIEKNRKMMEYMIGTIDQYVDDPRRQQANRNMNLFRRFISLMCFMFGKFLGNYLVILYLFIKMLYIVNCLGQLFLISVLLGRNYYIYGATIFRDMLQGKGYADSEYFPRVTMCKFQVRELGIKNFSHEYNVQCVLPINLFNQQIFTFLWFWYLILLIINSASLLIWMYRFIPSNQYNYVIRRIKLLRIRLIETSKLPKEADPKFANTGRFSNMQTMFNSNETSSYAKKTPISRILNERDYHYSYDEDKSDSAKTCKYELNESMFPNIHSSFDITHITQDSVKFRNTTKKDSGTKRNSYDQLKPIRVPIITEYDTYMSPSSFCIKNYKKFVFEYLEADGMFMLRMIGSNSGDFVCTQVLHNLWKLFLFKKFSFKNYVHNDKTEVARPVANKAATRHGDTLSSDDDDDEQPFPDYKQASKTRAKRTCITKLFKDKSNANAGKFYKSKSDTSNSINTEDSRNSFTELKKLQMKKKSKNLLAKSQHIKL